VAVPIDDPLAHLGKISGACDITGHARGVAADVGYAGADKGEGSLSRPCSTTRAPAFANVIAMAAPITRELPVTRATRSFRALILLSSYHRQKTATTAPTGAPRSRETRGSDGLVKRPDA
jgi:hypothetical protein